MRKSSSHILFCPEHYTEIRNYELAAKDNFIGWVCHHINGEWWDKEWLMKNNMYFDRSDPHELIFLPSTKKKSLETGLPTHNSVHDKTDNGQLSNNKVREKLKGRPGHKHTEEFKQAMRERLRGKSKSEEHKQHIRESITAEHRKIFADTARKTWTGRHHKTNTLIKMSAARKGKHKYNDGVKNIYADSCPEGFKPGWIKEKLK